MAEVGSSIFGDSLLEEVCLALQRDHVHEVERIGGLVVFGIAKRQQKMVRNELDILVHEAHIHTDQIDWECILYQDISSDNFMVRS